MKTILNKINQILRKLGIIESSVMYLWAEKEVNLACERERKLSEDNDWDYGVACYEAALEVYKLLLNQGHSGGSIGVTRQILNALIDGRPLTPIENTEDVWNLVHEDKKEVMFQNKRCSALFKNINKETGIASFHNVDVVVCFDMDSNIGYHCRHVSRLIHERFPITFPYVPSDPIKVYCQTFLVNAKEGDYDTRGVFYAIKSNGEKIEINKFFKYIGNDIIEISFTEFYERESAKINI